MAYKMAIVEDEAAAAETLKKMIERYGRENRSSETFEVSVFSDAYAFLADNESFDVIFLDIQMAGLNGIQAAREIRKKDEDVLIVFVTNMAQYAVESYEVHAYDFILKPLAYGNFFMKFRRILKQIEHTSNDSYCVLSTRYERRRVRILDIVYVEVMNHNLIFHLNGGGGEEEIRIVGTMNDWEKNLAPNHFVRCNSCFLVNLRYISALRGEYIVIGGQELHISRAKKQFFMTEFAKYVGGSV